MIKVLNLTEAAVAGIVAVISLVSLLIHLDQAIYPAVALALALIALCIALAGFKAKAPGARFVALKVTLAVALVVCGVVLIVRGMLGTGASAIVFGVIFAGIALLEPKLPETKTCEMFDSQGAQLALVKRVSYLNGDLVMGTTLMGMMPYSMYIRPRTIWDLICMLDFDTIKMVPGMLVKGCKEANKSE